MIGVSGENGAASGGVTLVFTSFAASLLLNRKKTASIAAMENIVSPASRIRTRRDEACLPNLICALRRRILQPHDYNLPISKPRRHENSVIGSPVSSSKSDSELLT